MPLVRWVFDDPTDASTYTVDLNPNDGGSPALQKNIQYVNTAGPNGAVLAFEGRDNAQEIEISGVIKEESHLVAFQTWFEKRHQVQVTDDIGRVFVIYITYFQAQRKRSMLYPWKHDYTMRYTLIDW